MAKEKFTVEVFAAQGEKLEKLAKEIEAEKAKKTELVRELATANGRWGRTLIAKRDKPERDRLAKLGGSAAKIAAYRKQEAERKGGSK